MKSLFLLIMMLQVAWSHDRVNNSRRQMQPTVQENGYEDTYMEYSQPWKRIIIEMARECIKDIKNSMHLTDIITWVIDKDLRHQVGVTMGRMMELHRAQIDMYRRMKRVGESRFNWLRPELSMKFPDKPDLQGPDAVVEPSRIVNIKPQEYDQEWAKGNKRTYNDYKPHVYIVALEYITKKEIEIEHLVVLLNEFTLDHEVGRFVQNEPVGEMGFAATFKAYATKSGSLRATTRMLRQGAEESKEAKMQDREEMLKAKMREEYYKKKTNKQ